MDQPFAIASDVAAIWRELTPAEVGIAEARIDQASAIIRSQVPDVDDRIAAGTLAASVVAGVVADMVRRVMLNPDGVRQRSRSIDDYTEAETTDQAVSEGALYLTTREYRLLTGSGRRAKAFMIVPSSGAEWCW